MKNYRLYFKLTFHGDFEGFQKGDVEWLSYYWTSVDDSFLTACDKCIESVIDYYQECAFEFISFEVVNGRF